MGQGAASNASGALDESNAMRGATSTAASSGTLQPAPLGGLVGQVRLPATILSNNGAQIVSQNGGKMISDQGGAVLSNNGATILSDRGGGLVSDRGGGLVSDRGGAGYALRQTTNTGPGEALTAIVNAQVGLFDARGEAVRDTSGAPLVATTDAEGRFVFPAIPQDRAVVAVCQLAGTAGQAAALVPKARGVTELDLASSVMASYVIGRFARPQADPQAALERLPAALEMQAREATAEALAQGAGPARLEATEVVAVVDSLRAQARKEAAEAVAAPDAVRGKAGAVDRLYEEIKQVMLVAGWSNFGEGQPVSAVNLSFRDAHRTAKGRWWLTDSSLDRTWEVVDGRLRVLVGSALSRPSQALQGMLATEAAFGRLQRVREGPDGTPWVLSSTALYRIGSDGRLTVLWERPPQETWHPVDALPLGGDQALVIGQDRVVAVGGAPEYQAPPMQPQGPGATSVAWLFKAINVSPDGLLRVMRLNLSFEAGLKVRSELWGLRPGLLPEEATFPVEPRQYGMDDAGNLVSGDGKGTIRFHHPGGGPPTVWGPEVLASWPEALRRAFDGQRAVQFGGDVRTLGWAYGGTPSVLVAYGPDGRAQPVFEGMGKPSATTEDGRTGLIEPGLVAVAPSGTTYVLDAGVVLSVNEGRAELFAGQRTIGSLPRVSGFVEDPCFSDEDEEERDCVEPTLPGGAVDLHLKVWAGGKKVTSVPGFGVGYEAPAREAFLVSPVALRVAADGPVWVLDTAYGEDGRYVAMIRRVVGGRLETVAVHSSNSQQWLDMVLAADGSAVMLTTDEVDLRLLKVRGQEPPVELVRVPVPDQAEVAADGVPDDEISEDESSAHRRDGMVSLPKGAWLLSAQGILWHWMPGQAPRRLPLGFKDSTFEFNRHSALSMVASADGKVAVADNDQVYRIDLVTGRLTPAVGAGTGNFGGQTIDTSLQSISGLAVAPNGDLLISDDETRQIKRVPAAAW
ncbi:MAG: hypothetical protein VKQ33_01625 [Candidatus Sericytochromatia bacterium]|nr:hypothetical protein [Candidatus Sericytochromatia bacterium]